MRYTLYYPSPSGGSCASGSESLAAGCKTGREIDYGAVQMQGNTWKNIKRQKVKKTQGYLYILWEFAEYGLKCINIPDLVPAFG